MPCPIESGTKTSATTYIYFRIDYTGNSEIRTVTHNHGVVVLIIDSQIYCCTNKMYAVYRYNTADCNGTTNSTT